MWLVPTKTPLKRNEDGFKKYMSTFLNVNLFCYAMMKIESNLSHWMSHCHACLICKYLCYVNVF